MRIPFVLAAGLALAATVPAGAAPADRNLIDRSCRLTKNGVTAPPPFGDAPCPGVRPGAAYVTTVGGCTLGYVFSGSDRATYVATAAHCAVDNNTTMAWPKGNGPVAGDPVTGKEFGRFVYATRNDAGNSDFALVKLNKGVPYDPQMCYFGGPTGIATNVDFDPVALVHYGNGYAMDYTQARTAYAAHGLRRPDWVTAFGAMSPGDSGGPVGTDTGLAVGVVDQIAVNGNGYLIVQRLGPGVDAAQKALRLKLTLRTAPLR